DVHDSPFPGRRRDEPADDRCDRSEVRNRRVQGDGHPDREARDVGARRRSPGDRGLRHLSTCASRGWPDYTRSMSVPARISIITIGIEDVTRSFRFYEALGWE